MRDTVTSVGKYGTESLMDQVEVSKLLVSGSFDRYEVEWDAEAKVTPMESLVFFAQYLQSAGLMDWLCQGTPLAYTSNNAPKERDVLGTILLSVLNGQTRYAHINALRGDRVGAELLGVSKVVSEDSVRRALRRGTLEQWDSLLTSRVAWSMNLLYWLPTMIRSDLTYTTRSVAFAKWLRGKVLDPVVEGDQILLQLLA